MGEEGTKKIESEVVVPQEAHAEDPSYHKALVPLPVISTPSPIAANHDVEKTPGDSIDRDAALVRVETEKRLALIKAWEDSEKTKADNKAYKRLSAIGAWENTQRASKEAQLKQIEEEFEKKKAGHVEKMKNKIAQIHKAAEEKRAIVEAKRGQETLKVEEVAAKFIATGTTPKKLFGFLGC